MPYSCKESLRSLIVAIAAFALASLGYGQATTLVGNENISGTATVLSGGNLTLASGSTMTYAIAGTTNSLLYITNGGGNVGALGLAAGLSVSGGNLVAASSTSHNPTATIGLAAVNGAAGTFMTSDSAPALSQAIVPTWTGLHTFQVTAVKTSGTDYGMELLPILNQRNATNFSAIYIDEYITQAGTGNQYFLECATGGGSPTDYFDVDNAGEVTTGVWKATVVGPTYGGTGLSSFAEGTTLTASAANTWVALAPGTVNYVYTSGGAGAVTSWQSLSTILDTLGTAAQGQILYRDSSAWKFLAVGTSGQVLETQGASANPQWVNASTPPGSTTNHDIASYSGTAGALEDLGTASLGSSQLSITETNATATGAVNVTNNSSSSSVIGLSVLAPSLSTGADNVLRNYIGVTSASAKNVGYIGFGYVGAGSTSNFMVLGFYSTNDVWSITTAGAVTQTGKIVSYNGATSAGWGVEQVVGYARNTGQSAATAAGAFTVGGADGSFDVSANVNVTAAVTCNFTVTCTYTDETNTGRVLTLGFTQLSGATLLTAITNVTGTGPYESPVYHIRAKSGTTITLASAAGGTYTSVTYNIEGRISETD